MTGDGRGVITGEVATVQQLEVIVSGIKIADDGVTIAVQHQRGVKANTNSSVGRGDTLVTASAAGVIAVH